MVIKSKQNISKVYKILLRYVKQKIQNVKNSLKKKKNELSLPDFKSQYKREVWH